MDKTNCSGSSFWTLLKIEYRLFSTDRTVWTLVIAGVIGYALMYGFMYRTEVVRGVPLALVDEDATPASRLFVRRLQATPQVSVVLRCERMDRATEALREGRVEGVVRLPRGGAPRYVVQASTASLLTYAAVQEALAAVALSMDGAVSAPVSVVGLALYNPMGGYGSYLLPAVWMVILFQTLLMAVSVRLGSDAAEGYRRWRPFLSGPHPRVGERWAGAVRLVGARLAVYGAGYAAMVPFLVGWVPWLFDMPRQGSATVWLPFMGAYVAASVAFALACIPLFREREGGLVGIAFFSLGYLFLSGISYPLQGMPAVWRVVRILFPVCPGVQGFVQLRSMGATFGEISPQFLLLLLQAKVYISIAVVGQYYVLKKAF